MEQVPVAIMVEVAPETVQTVGVVDLKATATPELADAVKLMVAPTTCDGIDAKVIVWFILPIAVPVSRIDCVELAALTPFSALSISTIVPWFAPTC